MQSIVLHRADNTLAATALVDKELTLAATAKLVAKDLIPEGMDCGDIYIVLYAPDGQSIARCGTYKQVFYSDEIKVFLTGTWKDINSQGHVTRRQRFERGGLDDIHLYSETTSPDFDAGKSPDIIESVITLATGEPSRESFILICNQIVILAHVDSDKLCDDILPNLLTTIQTWPSELRAAPLLWILHLVEGSLPVEVLSLVSALSLSAVVGRSPFSYLLEEWLAEYPADGPTVEGISWSYRTTIIEALKKEFRSSKHIFEKQSAFFNALCGESMFENSDFSDGVIEALLRSGLCRSLRVLDLSLEPPFFDIDERRATGLESGRHISVGMIGSLSNRKDLVALDLYGQLFTAISQLRLGYWDEGELSFPVLQHLNIGGGHPVGAKSIERIAALCLNLQTLHLAAGPARDAIVVRSEVFIDGGIYDFSNPRCEEKCKVLAKLWSISNNEDLDAMKLTPKSWRILKSMNLQKLGCGEEHKGRPKLGSTAIVRDDSMELWSQYFQA